MKSKEPLFLTKCSDEDQVWMVLHVLEMLTTALAFSYHIKGVFRNPKEPFEHIVYCCGVFCAFLIYEIIDMFRIMTGGFRKFLYLLVIETFATLAFFTSAMISMHFAEIDVHLQYMDMKQEDRHPFFYYSRAQGIMSIATSTLHLLHVCLLADTYFSYDFKRTKKKKIRQSFYPRLSLRRKTLTSIATQPIVLAVFHEEISCLVWIKKKLTNLFKKKDRDKSMLLVPKNWKKTGQAKMSTGSGSVRFTWGYM